MTAICVITILIYAICTVKGFRPQEIILFAEEDFKGRHKSFYDSHPDLRSDSVGKVAKSHCVVRGLWRVSGTFNSTPDARFIENIYGDEKNGKVCGTWNSQNQTAEYQSILLVGAQDLDTPAIQFHVRPRFYGDPDLYFDGRILRLQQPMTFASYGFTGRQNWTIFKNTDLTGHSQCLVANVDHDGDFLVSFNVNRTLTVGSVWRGCGALDPQVLGRQALNEDKNSAKVNSIKESLIMIILVALLY